jgi:hypothetical protein
MDARYEDAYRRARDAKLAELKGDPGYARNRVLAGVAGAVLGGIVGGVAGGVAGAAGLAVVGAVVGVAAFLVWVNVKARRAGQSARILLWASDNGFTYTETIDPPQTVGFLRNHQEPEAHHCFAGPIAGGDGRVYQFTYITWETHTHTNANGSTYTTQEKEHHNFTVLEVARPLPLPRMELSRRATGLFHGLTDRLEGLGGERTVELESDEFNNRFQLEVPDEADDLTVRRIFTPRTIVRLVEGEGLLADFQYENGTFCFWQNGHFDLDGLDEVKRFIDEAAPTIDIVCEDA